MFGLPAVNEFNASLFTYYFKSVFPYIMPIIYPVGMIAQTGSVYLASNTSIHVGRVGFVAQLMKLLPLAVSVSKV